MQGRDNNEYKLLVRNVIGKDLDIHKRAVLKWVLNKLVVRL